MPIVTAGVRSTRDDTSPLRPRPVIASFPRSPATLYAEALFLLEPRRGRRDISSPSVQRLHQVLEGILARDITHPGACHLYVHATESTTEPGKAEACAEHLGNSIPGASHINHMPSHTWNGIGRWGDSVRANLQAWHSDLKAGIGEGFAIYPSHNLHMLAFAASMDGQGAIVIQAGKDYAKLTNDTMYHVLTLVRFGRFDEIAAVAHRPAADVSAGMWDFAQGYAKLRLGESDMARVYLERVQRAAATSTASFRSHPASRLLGVAGGILEGRSCANRATLPAPLSPSSAPSSTTTPSSTTSPSRCPSPRTTGWARRSWKPVVRLKPSASIAPTSSRIRTTAGRSSA